MLRHVLYDSPAWHMPATVHSASSVRVWHAAVCSSGASALLCNVLVSLARGPSDGLLGIWAVWASPWSLNFSVSFVPGFAA